MATIKKTVRCGGRGRNLPVDGVDGYAVDFPIAEVDAAKVRQVLFSRLGTMSLAWPCGSWWLLRCFPGQSHLRG